MDGIIATDEQIEQILQQITVNPEQSADGIAVLDLAGTICFFNPAWAAIHGYNAIDKLIGKHIGEFHTEEHMKALVDAFIEEAKRRGQLAGPVEHLRSDGTIFCSQTKMTTARDKEDKTIGLIVFASNDGRDRNRHHLSSPTTEPETVNEQLREQIAEYKNTENELKKQHAQLEQRLIQQNVELAAVKEQLQNEITEHQQIQQRLKQQADELITVLATNERLQSQISEHQDAEKILKQKIDKLTSANEQLKHRIIEQSHTTDKLKIHNDMLDRYIEQQAAELKADDIKLKQMLTEQQAKTQADAEKTISNIKTEYEQQITQLKIEAEAVITNEKTRAEEAVEQMAKIKNELEEAATKAKSEAEEKEKAYNETTARLQAKANEKAKAHAEQIAELTEANKKLQNELTKQKQAQNALKKDREQIEQCVGRQITELTTAGEQLQQEITKRKQLEQRLRQQTDKLTTANKQIQQTSTKQVQTTQRLSEQSLQLEATAHQLQQEIVLRRQAEETLADLQEKLDNIRLIARKYS